ncbi:SDR family NAD(P)-dependent oxidoreductase [Pseudomonadota bacterium]
MKFSQCNALVTGGASGLGLATAKRVLAAGGKVAVLDMAGDLRATTVKELGSNALFVSADVSSESAVNQAVSSAVDFLGEITLTVNCAGIAPSHRVLAREGLMETSQFVSVISINLIGTFMVCRAVANVMQHNSPHGEDEERGVIINTASVAAIEGQIGQAAYAASKGGVVSMALPLAREFSRIGIRVMTIAPGIFETPMFDTLPVEAREALAANVPYPKRLGKADEFAQLVEQIYENSMLNGEVIRLDGALRMQPK